LVLSASNLLRVHSSVFLVPAIQLQSHAPNPTSVVLNEFLASVSAEMDSCRRGRGRVSSSSLQRRRRLREEGGERTHEREELCGGKAACEEEHPRLLHVAVQRLQGATKRRQNRASAVPLMRIRRGERSAP